VLFFVLLERWLQNSILVDFWPKCWTPSPATSHRDLSATLNCAFLWGIDGSIRRSTLRMLC
jgi:hypothetical protein